MKNSAQTPLKNLDDFSQDDPRWLMLSKALAEQVQQLQWDQAWKTLDVMLAFWPDDVHALSWRGFVALALPTPYVDEAIEAGQRALSLLPEHASQIRCDVWVNLGQAHTLLKQYDQALHAYDQAVQLNGQDAAALLGRSRTLTQLGDDVEAGRAAILALQCNPKNREALTLVAGHLLRMGQIERALDLYIQLAQLSPAEPQWLSKVILLMRTLAAWGIPQIPVSLDEAKFLDSLALEPQEGLLELLKLRAQSGLLTLDPQAAQSFYDDPQLQHTVAKQHMAQFIHWSKLPSQRPARGLAAAVGSRPLRVAYLVGEASDAHFCRVLNWVLPHHSEQVQVHVLSSAVVKTPFHAQLQAAAATFHHGWVDASQWSALELAQWCRQHEIDMAVDVNGFVPSKLLLALGMSLAPVQVNWLGLASTTPGVVDWVLADALALPVELEPHFSEKVWRLPNCFLPLMALPEPLPSTTRQAHGLPDDALVLACQQPVYKINKAVWDIWMRLLKVNAQAVLWLFDVHAGAQRNLRLHAQNAGIDPARLIFALPTDELNHLARLSLADLSLDTWPANAHMTTVDALRAGVPHLSVQGQSFSSRLGVSLLNAAGLPDLATAGLIEYEAKALHGLLKPQVRQAWRERLAQAMREAPGWNPRQWVLDLEAAFVGMVEAAQVQQAAQAAPVANESISEEGPASTAASIEPKSDS